jgi:hypothetical protein
MYMSAVITTCLYTVGASASIREVSGKEREREHMGANVLASLL